MNNPSKQLILQSFFTVLTFIVISNRAMCQNIDYAIIKLQTTDTICLPKFNCYFRQIFPEKSLDKTIFSSDGKPFIECKIFTDRECLYRLVINERHAISIIISPKKQIQITLDMRNNKLNIIKIIGSKETESYIQWDNFYSDQVRLIGTYYNSFINNKISRSVYEDNIRRLFNLTSSSLIKYDNSLISSIGFIDLLYFEPDSEKVLTKFKYEALLTELEEKFSNDTNIAYARMSFSNMFKKEVLLKDLQIKSN